MTIKKSFERYSQETKERDVIVENMGKEEWEATVSHIGQIASPYMSDLPDLQKRLVLDRVGQRVGHRVVADAVVRRIVIEETRFVQACM